MKPEQEKADDKAAQDREQVAAAEPKRDVLPERAPPVLKGGDAAGVTESQRPSHPDDSMPSSTKKRLPSQIVVYRDWCKACGICIDFCPTRVFDRVQGGYPDVARPDKCISCDLCELLCPDFAIMLTRPTDGQKED